MYKDTLNTLFEKVLNEGDGEDISRMLDPELMPGSADGSGMFDDPKFIREIERFIVKNRLSIATSYSRFLLRRARAKLEASYKGSTSGEFKIPAV